MNKNLLYTALGLIGIMGALAIGVVRADTSEPYGYVDYTLNGGQPFEAQVITITNGTDTITILDRNLGATAAGTGCEDPSWGTACAGGDDTYGYHFQWGNNYGFDPMDNDIATNSVSVTTNGVERSGNYSNSGYYGDTFIKSTRNPYGYDYWTDSVNNGPNHYDLWGGSLTESTDGVDADVFDDSYINGDDWKVNLETVTNRRGPCPENFHVPSAGELAKLVKMFGLDSEWNNYEDVSRAMHSQLKIPFAG